MEFLGQSPSLAREGKPCGAGTDTEDMWQTEGGVFRPWGHAERPAILPVRTSRSMCRFRSRKMRENGRRTGGQTGRQYGRLYQTDSENQEKYNTCFCIIFPKKRKWTIPDSQYLWVADRNAHEHSCPWTNKNIGNLKMMAENRTCLVASRRNKKKRQDYFESSSFSTNPIGIHSKLPCHFFLISIQYIYPSNFAPFGRCGSPNICGSQCML